jgi:RNA polymerase sigma-70 factor (ECF subfamily)
MPGTISVIFLANRKMVSGLGSPGASYLGREPVSGIALLGGYVVSAPKFGPHRRPSHIELPQLDTPSSVSPPKMVEANDGEKLTLPRDGSPKVGSSVPTEVAEAVKKELDKLYETGWRYALRLTKNEADAADLLQGAALRALQKSAQLRDPGRSRSWLFRIIRSRFLSNKRQERRLESLDESVRSAPSDRGKLEREARINDIVLAVRRLPSKERLYVQLRYFEKWALSDIAEYMGLSPWTADRLHKAALRALKIELLE